MHLFRTRKQMSFGSRDPLVDQLLLLLLTHVGTTSSPKLVSLDLSVAPIATLGPIHELAHHVDKVAVLRVHERERAERLAAAHHLVKLVRLDHYRTLVRQERLERVHAALAAQHACEKLIVIQTRQNKLTETGGLFCFFN